MTGVQPSHPPAAGTHNQYGMLSCPPGCRGWTVGPAACSCNAPTPSAWLTAPSLPAGVCRADQGADRGCTQGAGRGPLQSGGGPAGPCAFCAPRQAASHGLGGAAARQSPPLSIGCSGGAHPVPTLYCPWTPDWLSQGSRFDMEAHRSGILPPVAHAGPWLCLAIGGPLWHVPEHAPHFSACVPWPSCSAVQPADQHGSGSRKRLAVPGS